MGLQTSSKTIVRVKKGQHGTLKVTPLGRGRVEITAPAAWVIEQIRGRRRTESSRRRQGRNRKAV